MIVVFLKTLPDNSRSACRTAVVYANSGAHEFIATEFIQLKLANLRLTLSPL